MKFRIFIVVLLVAAAAVAGRQVNKMRNAGTNNAGGSTRDEIRRSFRLTQGARIEVRHINGSVEIETADADTAEVHVVSTADSHEDLESRRVIIEDSPDSLVVRGESGGGNGWWHRLWGGGQVRQQLRLTIPRGASLAVGHVNGPLAVGEMDGAVEVRHVNGRVELSSVSGRTEVAHVNGGVKLGLARLDEQGMEVSHINGNVEIRLKESLDADIDVSRHNGGFALNAPNVTSRERESRSTFRARLGSGGPEINILRVNGNVRFESNASTVAPAQPDAPDAGNLEPPPPPPPAPPTFR